MRMAEVAVVELDSGGGAGPEELDSLTRQLRQELLQLDVRSVDRPSLGPSPDDSKGLPIVAIGTLVVQLASSQAIQQVVDVLKRWVGIDRRRTVKVAVGDQTIELTSATIGQQQQIVDAWVKSITSSRPD